MFTLGTPGVMFSDWLYGEYDQNKLMQFEMLYHVPFVRDYMDYLLDTRADEEYLKRYGMTYSDVHDPRKLHQVSSGANFYGSSIRMVGRNVDKLYR